jgi:hypothetical protein
MLEQRLDHSKRSLGAETEKVREGDFEREKRGIAARASARRWKKET